MNITSDGKKLAGRLMHIDATNWPPTVTLAPEARIRTHGRHYELTSATSPRERAAGGEVVDRTGQREPWRFDIADLLRDQIPADDDRWLSRDTVPLSDDTTAALMDELTRSLRSEGQTADDENLMHQAADTLDAAQQKIAHLEDLIAAVRGEIDHAAFNGHVLSDDCQGVDPGNPAPAVRVDSIEAALDRPAPGTPRIG